MREMESERDAEGHLVMLWLGQGQEPAPPSSCPLSMNDVPCAMMGRSFLHTQTTALISNSVG